jgi:ABC-2 type transport system ATP-binding protein
MNTALEIHGLTVRFKRFTLGPVDLALEPGRVTGLVGPNGSGKTTTLRCVAGNLYPDAGAINVHGRTASHDDGSWKEVIGYVPDNPCFFERMTAGGFLSFMSAFYPDWSHSFAARLVDRFKLDQGTRVKHLSAGNRMKVSLVAALAHKPRLALFDEPTAGLDPLVRTQVFDVLWEMMENEDMTVLYSTHIMDDLHRLADDLVFLHDGRVALHSSKDDLLDRWRRIRFGLDRDIPGLASVVETTRKGMEHEVISSDGETTLTALSDVGATRVRAQALTLEEIAVSIMKGNGDVSHRHR